MTVFRPWRRGVLALGLFLGMSFATVNAADDWHVVRLEGRDYLPLADVARFYGFPNPVPPASQILPENPAEPLTKIITLDNGRQQLEFTLNGREAIINGVREWLAFPVTVQNDQVLISRLDLAKTVEPALRPEMIGNMQAVETVVLDPGHGGHDKGAVSIFGNEKDFALDVCLRLKKLLEAAGLRVVMTRDTDVFIPLEQRPAVANRISNSIFVAVHFNDALMNPVASGFEIYSITPRGGPSSADNTLTPRDLHAEPGNVVDVQSRALSAAIYHAMVGNIPEVDRGMKTARFAVIRLATVPAVLIEGGFVSSSTESRLIATPAWRQRLAESIAAGIEGFKGLAEQKLPPKVVADYRRAGTSSVALRDLSPSTGAGGNTTTAPTVITNSPPEATGPAPHLP